MGKRYPDALATPRHGLGKGRMGEGAVACGHLHICCDFRW